MVTQIQKTQHIWCTERNVTSETWNDSQLLSSYSLLAQVSFWHKVAAPSVFALQYGLKNSNVSLFIFFNQI